jgi:hypothetical protein
MVKIVRGPIVEDVLCAAQKIGDDLLVYVPADEISVEMAYALSDVLTESLDRALPAHRLAG